MPTWAPNPIASYTGSFFSQYLPAAAADLSGNLLIAWVDRSNNLNLSYATTTSCKVLQPVVVAGQAQGSPSVAYSVIEKCFYVFWRTQGSGQLQYGVSKVPTGGLASMTVGGYLNGATSADGPQVVAADANVIWVAWRGNNTAGDDQGIYLGTLVGSSWTAPFSRGTSSMNSLYSPAVCVLPDPPSGSGVVVVWKGVGNDERLFQAYGPVAPSRSVITAFRSNIEIPSFTSNNRPSLAVSEGKALLVYTAGQSIFSTTTSVSRANSEAPQWTGPVAVPNVLANPAAVLVAQPKPDSPVYLLVSDALNGIVKCFLNLYQYS